MFVLLSLTGLPNDLINVIHIYLTNCCLTNCCLTNCIINNEDANKLGIDYYITRPSLYWLCYNNTLLVKKYIHLFNHYELKMGLHSAIRNGSLEITTFVAKFIMHDVSTDDLNVMLANACYRGHLNIVKFLVNNNIGSFYVALKSACSGGHINIVKYLIGMKNIITIKDLNRGLYWACYGNQIELAKYMIDLGANDYNRGFCAACRMSHNGSYLELVKFLASQTISQKTIINALQNTHDVLIKSVIKK